MAANIFNDTVSGDGLVSTVANWTEGRVPTGTDVMTFTGTGLGSDTNCTFDVGVACAGIDMQADYTADVDAVTFDYTGGTVTLAGSGTFDLGTGTWLIAGGLIFNAVGTFDGGDAIVQFDGTGNLRTSVEYTNRIDLIEILDGGDITTITSTTYLKNVNIYGGGTLTCDVTSVAFIGSLRVYAGGTLSGSGQLQLQGTPVGAGILLQAGTVDVATLAFAGPANGAVMVGGDYACALLDISTSSTDSGATRKVIALGDIDLSGDIEIRGPSNGTSSAELNLATNDAGLIVGGDFTFRPRDDGDTILSVGAGDLHFKGDIDFQVSGGTGDHIWNLGTGNVYIDGTGNQSIDFLDTPVDAIIIDSTATVTLDSSLTTDSFTGRNGTFDTTGVDITTVLDMDWRAGFVLADPVGSTFSVGRNFTADGQVIPASGAWTLTVDNGTAVASGVGDVAHSDASAGTPIKAFGWTDSLNNTNWQFVNTQEDTIFVETEIFSGACAAVKVTCQSTSASVLEVNVPGLHEAGDWYPLQVGESREFAIANRSLTTINVRPVGATADVAWGVIAQDLRA